MEEVKCWICGYFVHESKAVFDNLGNTTCLDCDRELEEFAYKHGGEE